MTPLTDEQIEQKIEEFFDRNYELLRAEGNRPLTAELRKKALNQVKMYFQKLKDIATQVTDTEVKLTLPEQRTPEGRRFAIEGVVDIVKEADETWMYDIKTHQPELIREDIKYYAEQLNVYTYIWQNLRQNELDKTAVISTTFPRALERALKDDNPAMVSREFANWDPVIEIPFEQENVAEMIENFGEVVDKIENKEFAAPPKEKLEERYLKSKGSFGTKVCRFCDARYSCSAYRAFAATRYQRGLNFSHFFREDMDEFEQEVFLEGNLSE